MSASPDDVSPVHNATVQVLHNMSDQWIDYDAVATTEPRERAATRMIAAGLIEVAGVLVFTRSGSSTRLEVEGRWTGAVPQDQINAMMLQVPEWIENGALKAETAYMADCSRMRLTHHGLVAQSDIRSKQNQHMALTLIWGGTVSPQGVSQVGRLLVDIQRIQRPIDPTRDGGRM
jgi:hypothetical protein